MSGVFAIPDDIQDDISAIIQILPIALLAAAIVASSASSYPQYSTPAFLLTAVYIFLVFTPSLDLSLAQYLQHYAFYAVMIGAVTYKSEVASAFDFEWRGIYQRGVWLLSSVRSEVGRVCAFIYILLRGEDW